MDLQGTTKGHFVDFLAIFVNLSLKLVRKRRFCHKKKYLDPLKHNVKEKIWSDPRSSPGAVIGLIWLKFKRFSSRGDATSQTATMFSNGGAGCDPILVPISCL